MPLKKKKRSCPFSSATARWKKPKTLFSSDWAENLAESDKGSYFDQEQWLKELNKKRRFPHQHLVQAAQKLRLKDLLQIWKAKTLKHGKSSMATLVVWGAPQFPFFCCGIAVE